MFKTSFRALSIIEHTKHSLAPAERPIKREMNQSSHQKMSLSIFVPLAFTLPRDIILAFSPPQPLFNWYVSSSHRFAPHSVFVLSSSAQLSLETILENPDCFPNTSGILGSLSQDNTAGDYQEFLTALSKEWMHYSNYESNIISENESWIDNNISPSSPKIATAVGTATSYSTVQALDHLHHSESLNGYSTVLHEQQNLASDNLPSYYHPAAAEKYGFLSHLARDYGYEDSSPNLLRDLANSLPQPDDHLGMKDSINFDEYARYHDGNLYYYVADNGLNVAATNVPGGNEVTSPYIPDASTTGELLSANNQNAASDTTDTLSSQLPDIAYAQAFDHTETASKRFSMPQLSKVQTIRSHNADEAISKIKSFATHSTDAINEALVKAKTSGSSQLNNLIGSVHHSFDRLPEKVASIKSSSAESMSREFENVKLSSFDKLNVPNLGVSKLAAKIPQLPSIPGDKITMTTAESLGVEGHRAASSVHASFTDTSLADIGKSILGGIQSLSGIFFRFIDWIIATVAGTSLSQILNSVHISISTLIDNTSSSITNLINGLGDLTIREIFQAFLTLILVVTDMIFKVTNALVYLISGKDAGDWALQANSVVHTYGDQLLAKAGTAYQDVTHKSLGELAIAIGDYSHHVGEELLTVMNCFSPQSGTEIVTAGHMSSLTTDNLDNIAKAVQTSLTL